LRNFIAMWITRWRCRFWADCTINISEREFPTMLAVPASTPPAEATGNIAPIIEVEYKRLPG
jgi:hypothetical protein